MSRIRDGHNNVIIISEHAHAEIDSYAKDLRIDTTLYVNLV